MCRGQLTGILHVHAEIPKLLEADAANVDNVITLGDGRLGVLAVCQGSTDGHDEASEVFVKGKEAEQFGGRLAIRLGLGLDLRSRFLIRSHRLGRQVLHFVDIDGDAASVSSTRPLGILQRV